MNKTNKYTHTVINNNDNGYVINLVMMLLLSVVWCSKTRRDQMEFITKIFITHTHSWPNIRVIHKMRLHRCDLLIMSYVVYQTSKSSLTPPKKKREWHKNTQYITLLFTFLSKPYIKRIPFYVIHVHATSMRRLLSVYHLGYVNSEKKK